MSEIPKVILLVETSRGYGRDLLRGIAKYSRLHGPWIFYREPGGLKRALPRLKSWGATGMITRDSRRIQEVIAIGVPTIVAVHYKSLPDVPVIDTNPINIGKMAAEHLLNRGFRSFGYCGFDDMHWSEMRGKIFGQSVEEAGFDIYFYEQPKSKSKREWQNEQGILSNWLKSLPKPVGIMACNDDRGQHITEACKTAGLRIPDEVAVVGVDNDELVCDLTEPPLSSVALNIEKGGYEAAELLDHLMSGKKIATRKIIVEPMRVVGRQSTDVLAIEDPMVSEALRFIRGNAKRAIQVSDVVAAVAVSRRGLEQRFRKILGHSINREIRRVRVEQVARFLTETNKPVGQIALYLNYPGIDHIARYFRAEKGISPVAYRKLHHS